MHNSSDLIPFLPKGISNCHDQVCMAWFNRRPEQVHDNDRCIVRSGVLRTTGAVAACPLRRRRREHWKRSAARRTVHRSSTVNDGLRKVNRPHGALRHLILRPFCIAGLVRKAAAGADSLGLMSGTTSRGLCEAVFRVRA